MQEGRGYFKTLTGKPTAKRPLGMFRGTSTPILDDIRMDLKEIGINSRNRVDSAQDRDYWRFLVNASLDLRIP